MHRIVIVGGGAGGLELATMLGDRLGKRGRAHITLIDKKSTHFWKPHLHEIAAGSMNLGMHELSYMAQGHWHGFTDRIGEMTGLDRNRRVVHLAPHVDEFGEVVTPLRDIAYDTLVLAVGSRTNDFGTPGVREHAIALETPADAEQFHRRLVNACIRAHAQSEALRPHQLQVAIIGAGATGVELAAELTHTTRELLSYGLERLDHTQLGIHLIEAGPRILPAVPHRLSEGAARQLQALNVTVHTGARVSEVLERSVQLADGRCIPAELVVWAAGVKAPEFLSGLDGLESNGIHQLRVRPTLQSALDDDVFAIGDCAACPWLGREDNLCVPPRAQAAHQQASHLADGLVRRLAGKPLKPWRYRDFGSLISLGRYSTVGNLMGGLVGRNLWLEGYFAWLMYVSLYQMHQRALHGLPKAALDMLARFLSRGTRPRVKLH
ncbi:NAD(P)/FAD-dependent oxidoreductase [Polaromonas jejuensis]|uniref:NAD(P)/FAD-dependent oxidoreductase n=1 Tax=Polaromonas jejuensis TaxID=457502 RepID=A0ABW0QET2_9BURK|nr:NAD(P)/FAD-dependent oxidoreductase [Polaromonas jejuensis]